MGTNKISSYETELSPSNINKECTKLDKYSSSLDSKPLVLKTMEASMIKAPGKRLILPKTIRPQTNSMSLKNVINNEISKGHDTSSKGKVISRIVHHDANTGKKVLPTKPKLLFDTPQSQIYLVEANNTSQSQVLIADAELKNLIPARNLVEHVSALDNNYIDAGKNIKIEENYGTKKYNNVKNAGDSFTFICQDTDNDSHQGESVLPGRQLLNIDPFLSDTNNAIELINDIDSLNKVSTQEDPDKDQLILEEYIPVATNNTELQMDDDILFSWDAESLMNCEVPMSNDPMNPMTMVNPIEVEGKTFATEEIEIESASYSSTESQTQLLPIQESNTDAVVSDKDMEEAVKNVDDEWIDSILKQIDIIPSNNTTQNDVPVAEENDLLRMVMDDSIGMEAMAQICQTLP